MIIEITKLYIPNPNSEKITIDNNLIIDVIIDVFIKEELFPKACNAFVSGYSI